MIRPSRPVLAVALVVALAGGGAVLSGCSVARYAVEGASGGKVDIGGKTVPTDYPKQDVPLTTGDVIYGAALTTGGSRVWNVTVKVADQSVAGQITAQLQAVGFTASAAAGSDAAGSTATLTKPPYSVIVVVSKPDASTGWIANYTVTKALTTASPSPSPTPTK